MKNTILALYALCFLFYGAWAQEGGFEAPQVSSPTAAALGKYGDIPVSYHTGVPQISIPIYTIQEGSIQVPISMSYHSSGIRVDELASWVGLGWSLNAGGAITRTVNGMADEGGTAPLSGPRENTDKRGWYENKGLHPGLSDPTCYADPNNYPAIDGRYEDCYTNSEYRAPTCREFYLDAADGFIDTQPDMFNFNVGGQSGKFIFDDKGQVQFLPSSDFRVEPAADFSSWKLIAPDGTKYFFGGPSATEKSYSNGQGLAPSPELMRSTTWYLTRIESANGTHYVEFTYEQENYSYATVPSHSVTIYCDGTKQGDFGMPPVHAVKNDIEGWRLKQITTSSGKVIVDFEANSLRTDVSRYNNVSANNNEAKHLNQINITKGNNLRSFVLGHSYFVSNTTIPPHIAISDHDTRRLKLNSIHEESGGQQLEGHTFGYVETTGMCRRNALARDHWGYYNGALFNSGLIPTVDVNNVNNVSWNSVNREPDETDMEEWILNSIQYPTGGSTNFEYEAHRALHGGILKVVGGLRIKEITSYPGESQPTLTQTFTYKQPNLYGSYPTASSYVFTVNESAPEGPSYTMSPPQLCASYMVMGSPMVAARTPMGYHIGYGEVEVSSGSNGKSIYQYHNLPTQSIGGLYASSAVYPFLPGQNDLLASKLKYEAQEDATGNVVSSTTYEYGKTQSGLVVGLAVTSFSESTTGCNNKPTQIPIPSAREFRWEVGDVKLNRKIECVDGVCTTTDYTYSTHQAHNFPVEVSVTNSDGQVLKTRTTYFDHWFDYSGCQVDFGTCVDEFDAAARILWTQYAEGDLTGVAWSTAYRSLEETYWDCITDECIDWEDCRNGINTANQGTHPEVVEMVKRNILAPYEVKKYTGTTVTGGTNISYDLINFPGSTAPHILPTRYLQLAPPSTWINQIDVAYDEKDYMLAHKRESGISTDYIWNHDKGFMTAVVTNSDQAAVDATNYESKIAYTSFELQYEPDDNQLNFSTGGWDIFRGSGQLGGWDQSSARVQTGIHAFKIANRDNSQYRYVSKNVVAGKYTVSFWHHGSPINVKVGGQLILTSSGNIGTAPQLITVNFETNNNAVLEISCPGTSFIDELRLHPQNAQMATYAYDRAFRLQAETDANNRSNYYEYDDFGRLIYVKDQDQNYVQGNKYNYKN
ncbi:MAG: hypothetical protein AAF135_07350 [Bacteroidota bacterium]